MVHSAVVGLQVDVAVVADFGPASECADVILVVEPDVSNHVLRRAPTGWAAVVAQQHLHVAERVRWQHNCMYKN